MDQQPGAPTRPGTLRVHSILLAAVGGQGSNILTEWIFNAAGLAGNRAQAVGLPGISQRGGATSFYLEIASGPEPDLARVVFSQHPIPGRLDLLLGQEFLETARALHFGHGSARTTVVTSTHRVFTIGEKMVNHQGLLPPERLEAIARAFSGTYVGFNALELARQAGLDDVAVNAILLGAVCALGVLPIAETHYQDAIRHASVAVPMNLQAFELGRDFVAENRHLWRRSEETRDPWRPSVALAGRAAREWESLATVIRTDFPEPLHATLAEAAARLIDYQDGKHARAYLEEVARVLEVDRLGEGEGCGFRLSREFARGLASLMTYEDGARVAQLKLRRDRLDAIKRRLDVKPGQVYLVRDYLKPDAFELYGLLPAGLVRPLLAVADRLYPPSRRRGRRFFLEMKPATSTFGGALLLSLPALARPLRRRSLRYAVEAAHWTWYREQVIAFARRDYRLGEVVAAAGAITKGYGEVRRRALLATRAYVEQVIAPLAEAEARQDGSGFEVTLEAAASARQLIAASDAGIEKAVEMAQALVKGVEAGDDLSELRRLAGAAAA